MPGLRGKDVEENHLEMAPSPEPEDSHARQSSRCLPIPSFVFLSLTLATPGSILPIPSLAFVQRAEKKGEGRDKPHEQIKQETRLKASGLENVAGRSMTCLSAALTTWHILLPRLAPPTKASEYNGLIIPVVTAEGSTQRA